MRVFRIERQKYIKTTLMGIGASMTDGFRWNSLYTKVVYTTESRALALLEVSVHIDLSEDLPTDRNYVEIEIPDEVSMQEVLIEDLPLNWDCKPASTVTQFIGDDFVMDGEVAVLKVPSCIVPHEYNYLINPAHPDALKIKVIEVKKMVFDARMKLKK